MWGVVRMTRVHALTKLREAVETTGAALSVGLEPRPDALPDGFERSAAGVGSFLRAVVEQTTPYAAAYKPNLAFFEAMGTPGYALLESLHEMIPAHAVLLADAKRGDIGSTAEAYASSIFGAMRAHAVTVNPLMGEDAVLPFVEWSGGVEPLVYLLALTSNPGAQDFLLCDEGETTLAERIAFKASAWDAGRGRVGLVVGATRDGVMMRRVHDAAPGLPWLVPGVGAQGGSVSAVVGARPGVCDPAQMLIHATRSLMPGPGEGVEAIASRAARMHAQLAEAFAGRFESSTPHREPSA